MINTTNNYVFVVRAYYFTMIKFENLIVNDYYSIEKAIIIVLLKYEIKYVMQLNQIDRVNNRSFE